MKNILFSTVALVALATAGHATSLTNGSLTGPVTMHVAPPGWTPFNSVDTTSSPSQAFPFMVDPGPSPDGGTWAGLASGGAYLESITQTVTGFVIGQTYEVDWYGTNTGCCSGGYVADNSIFAALDGGTVYTSPLLSMDGLWHDLGYSFTATAMSHNLTFGIVAGPTAYMGIDGIRVAEAAVPLPAAGVLLLGGLGGLAAMRRKHRQA